MEKQREYPWTKFTPEVVKAGIGAFVRLAPKPPAALDISHSSGSVSKGKETWTFDDQVEFLAAYREECDDARVQISRDGTHLYITYRRSLFGAPQSTVAVKLGTRALIEDVFSVFEAGLASGAIPRPEPPPNPSWESKVKVFVGHGQSGAWKELKDHLQDKQKFAVEAYEGEPRAGQTTKDVLEEMLRHSTFAVLVLTGEDRDSEGRLHARENVVHELGLFQGKLGFGKAIALVEDGVSEFSNLHGIQQIRFPKGGIKETFGEVVATIRSAFTARPKQ